MADIVIFVGGVAPQDSGLLQYAGQAYCTGMVYNDTPVEWNVEVAYSALASAVNTAIKDAAIAAADVAGYTVGALDKKTLLAGAIGL